MIEKFSSWDMCMILVDSFIFLMQSWLTSLEIESITTHMRILKLIPYLDSNHFFLKKSWFNEFCRTCQSVPTTSQLGSKPMYQDKNNDDQLDLSDLILLSSLSLNMF